MIKCLEILAEAANRVTPEGRQAVGDLPWRDIIDMRRRRIHGYYDVNHGIVWSTLQEDIPALIQVLERALEPSDDR